MFYLSASVIDAGSIPFIRPDNKDIAHKPQKKSESSWLKFYARRSRLRNKIYIAKIPLQELLAQAAGSAFMVGEVGFEPAQAETDGFTDRSF